MQYNDIIKIANIGEQVIRNFLLNIQVTMAGV